MESWWRQDTLGDWDSDPSGCAPGHELGVDGAGDAWGCVGRWFSGRWHTAAAEEYVTKVKQYRDQEIWRTPDFQQP